MQNMEVLIYFYILLNSLHCCCNLIEYWINTVDMMLGAFVTVFLFMKVTVVVMNECVDFQNGMTG